MRRFLVSLSLILCSSVSAGPILLGGLDVSPWFGDFLEFYLAPSYIYRYYPDIESGKNPTNYSSHDQFLRIDLNTMIWPQLDIGLEAEFSNTRKLKWGTESAAIQGRYQFLDDVSGDPITFTGGLNIRWVPSRALRDVSTPYHSDVNVEFSAAIGKEIDYIYDWTYRFYAFLGIGFANHGYPWMRPVLSFEGKFADRHLYQIFAESYLGFGPKQSVNVRKFRGYAKIGHKSIDLGLAYRYKFDIWGSIGLDYSYRVYAHAFPERAHTLMLRYSLPFSFFAGG